MERRMTIGIVDLSPEKLVILFYCLTNISGGENTAEFLFDQK